MSHFQYVEFNSFYKYKCCLSLHIFVCTGNKLPTAPFQIVYIELYYLKEVGRRVGGMRV